LSELRERMEFASDLARQAGAVALRYFQTKLDVEEKPDRSPVTAADRAAEELIRKRIQEAYPEDGIEGEEFGKRPGKSGRLWLVDPIDGTKSFVQGVPLFGVLIGLQGPDGPEAGVVFLPALDELVCGARGEGAWWNGARARVSDVASLDQACLAYTSHKNFELLGPEAVAGWMRLSAASRLQRGWGDCYGHLLVATGRAEAMFDPILSDWDCGPFPAILEEAGGTFTDWRGNRTIRGASGISTNGKLFPEVMALLHGGGERRPAPPDRSAGVKTGTRRAP
jgi:histidinol-phosphatase